MDKTHRRLGYNIPSSSIFAPMAISIAPPNASTLRSKKCPSLSPTRTPAELTTRTIFCSTPMLAKTFVMRKEWTAAECLFRDSLRLNEEYANPLGVAETHRDLGKMQVLQGHKSDARASFAAALSEYRKLGAQADIAEVERLMRELENG